MRMPACAARTAVLTLTFAAVCAARGPDDDRERAETVRRQLGEIDVLLRDGHPGRALDVVERILGGAGDVLIGVADDPSLRTSARRQVRRRLDVLPPAVRTEHLERAGPAAAAALAAAVRSGRAADLRALVRRYPGTPAEGRALRRLADLLLDTGQPHAAAAALDRIAEPSPELRRRRRTAAALIGHDAADAADAADTADAADAAAAEPTTEGPDWRRVWSQPHGRPDRPAATDLPLPLLSPDWQHPLAAGGEVAAAPVAAGTPAALVLEDLAVVRGPDGTVHALNLDDGSLRWSHPEADGTAADPAPVADGPASEGEPSAAGPPQRSLSADRERIYLLGGSQPGSTLVAIDRDSGRPVWSAAAGGEGARFVAPPLVLGRRLYLLTASPDGLRLRWLRSTDGAATGEIALAAETPIAMPAGVPDVFPLAWRDGLVVVHHAGAATWAFDPVVEAVRWRATDPRAARPSRSGDGVAETGCGDVVLGPEIAVTVAAAPATLVARSLADGRLRWRTPLPDGAVRAVVGCSEQVCVVVTAQRLSAYAVADGTVVWSRLVPDLADRPLMSHSHLLAATADGVVLRLDLADGETVGRSGSQARSVLGALSMAGHTVVATGRTVQAFWTVDHTARQVARMLAADPGDPYGLILHARLARVADDLPTALDDLRRVLLATPPAPVRETALELLFDLCAHELRLRPELAGPVLPLLADAADTTARQECRLRTRIVHDNVRQPEALLEALREYAALPMEVPRRTEGPVRLHDPAAWTAQVLAGDLPELQLTSEARAAVAAAAQDLRGRLDTLSAEQLRPLTTWPDTVLPRAEVMTALRDRTTDPDLRTLAGAADPDLRTLAGAAEPAAVDGAAEIAGVGVSVATATGEETRWLTLEPSPDCSEAVRRRWHGLRRVGDDLTLHVEAADGDWTLPLPAAPWPEGVSAMPLHHAGSVLLFAAGRRVYAVGCQGRRLLWSRTFDGVGPQSWPILEVWSASAVAVRRHDRLEVLDPADGHRLWTRLETDRLFEGTLRVAGDARRLVLLDQSVNACEVRDSRSGRPIRRLDLADHPEYFGNRSPLPLELRLAVEAQRLPQAGDVIAALPAGLVTYKYEPGIGLRSLAVRRFDAAEMTWDTLAAGHTFSDNNPFFDGPRGDRGDSGRWHTRDASLSVLGYGGKLFVYDLARWRALPPDPLDAELAEGVERVYVHRHDAGTLVALDRQGSDRLPELPPVGFSSCRHLDGTLLSRDAAGRPRWSVPVADARIFLPPRADLPLVLTLADAAGGRTRLTVLHAATGRTLADETVAGRWPRPQLVCEPDRLRLVQDGREIVVAPEGS